MLWPRGGGLLVSGRMMQHRIRVLVGDTVSVEMTPYDLTNQTKIMAFCSLFV
jgi:hypothetical protein